jgi:hypothetical protein
MAWDSRIYIDRCAKEIAWHKNISCDHPKYTDVLRAAKNHLKINPKITEKRFNKYLEDLILRMV